MKKTLFTIAILIIGKGALSQLAIFEVGPEMNQERMEHHTAVLPNGNIGLFGGHTTGFVSLNTLEILDTATNTFTSISMNYTHSWPVFTQTNNGNFLIAGGSANMGVPQYSHAEIFNPSTNEFKIVDNMQLFRSGSSGAALNNGDIMVASAWWTHNEAHTYGELFNHQSESFTSIGPFAAARAHGIVIPTSDGNGVVLGGVKPTGSAFDFPIEEYHVASGEITTIQETLFEDEEGWTVRDRQSPSYQQTLADGKSLWLASKTESTYTKYRLFTFDPSTKKTAVVSLTQDLPTSELAILYKHPIIDIEKNRAYLPAIVPNQHTVIRIYTISLETGEIVGSENSFDVEYRIGSASAALLNNGKIFIGGGSITNNFDPVNKTLFITPPEIDEEVNSSPRIEQKNNIIIYPNPFQDVIYLDVDENKVKNINMYSLNGKQIELPMEGKKKINTSQLANGFYMIHIELTNGEAIKKKVVKQ